MNNDDIYKKIMDEHECRARLQDAQSLRQFTQPILTEGCLHTASRTISEPLKSNHWCSGNNCNCQQQALERVTDDHRQFDINELKIEINDLMQAIVRVQSRINKL